MCNHKLILAPVTLQPKTQLFSVGGRLHKDKFVIEKTDCASQLVARIMYIIIQMFFK